MTGEVRRLLAEIARVVEIVARVRDRADGLNEADTKAAITDPILGMLPCSGRSWCAIGGSAILPRYDATIVSPSGRR